MDLFTRDDFEALAHHDGGGAHVSLFLQTHPASSEVQTDPSRWRKLLNATEEALAEAGMRRDEIDALLTPAWELQRDPFAWRRMSDGLAVFLRPGWQRAFRVPISLPDLAIIGDRFVIGPLLRLLAGDAHFLVLALSRRKVRLLEGSRQRVEEVELADIPTSLRDVAELPEARSETVARPMAPPGRPGPAVFFGTGYADDEFKKDELERFLRQVANGLRDVLAASDRPMVLVGLEEVVGLYRKVNEYPHVIDEVVRRNPDDLSVEQLHELAWPVVAAALEADARDAYATFEALHGTGRASSDPDEIAQAAAEGRVGTLFVPVEPACWQRLATGGAPHVVRLGVDPEFAQCELLDRSAADTLAHGGRVYALSEQSDGRDAAAIFRY